jgi:uncharacterized protein
MNDADAKYEALKEFIKEKGKNGVVIAFSGGVDSVTLAAVCHIVLGDKAVAVTAQSPTYTQEEMQEAKKAAEEIGVKFQTVQTDEINNPEFTKNPPNRCYFCKKELLTKLLQAGKELGLEAVFEGTNFSDLKEHRPGFQAVKETFNVYSPWTETGFTKEEIRTIAKQLGLSVHAKLPQPCLATRIPYNESITVEKLKRIAEAEKAVKEITGAKELRVRAHNGLARIEVGKAERSRFFDETVLDEVSAKLKALGFRFIAFDLEGYRSGSMLQAL